MFFSALFASFLTFCVWVLCFYRGYAYCRDLGRRDLLERAILESRRREIGEFQSFFGNEGRGGGIEMTGPLGRTPNTVL
ncbi:hypothetical protein TrRE_jg12835 [Triparma retinervis]|uniref:Uncharacterized protein n=1 Tax=Triparma retinervis TaxID=2557542 RepID=A0A9W7FHB6_9STRA|nr:hypothetical protein TrRE_jg12835 [Triparma retinervis]